jgi:hypothetical protein
MRVLVYRTVVEHGQQENASRLLRHYYALCPACLLETGTKTPMPASRAFAIRLLLLTSSPTVGNEQMSNMPVNVENLSHGGRFRTKPST